MNTVESQGFAAAVGDAEHSLGRILEREALRRLEGKAELRMNEVAAADEPVCGIVSESDAVDCRR